MSFVKVTVILIGTFVLASCTSSNDISATGDVSAHSSPPSTSSPSDSATSTPPDPKEFAHRYNNLASSDLQVIDITGPAGVRGERWITLDLANKRDDIHSSDGSNIFQFSSSTLSPEAARRICTWMVQSFNPGMSVAEAASMATSVIDGKNKVIVKNTVLDVFPSKYETGCEVSSTGL